MRDVEESVSTCSKLTSAALDATTDLLISAENKARIKATLIEIATDVVFRIGIPFKNEVVTVSSSSTLRGIDWRRRARSLTF